METYHPIPFPEYQDSPYLRADCESRLQAIKKDYGDFRGKTLLDVGGAEGFFCFRFLQEGGKKAYLIEIDKAKRETAKRIAEENASDIKIYQFPAPVHADVGIYLDLFFEKGTEGLFDYVMSSSKTCYISPAGNNRNSELAEILKKQFSDVYEVYSGQPRPNNPERTIFRCKS